METLYRKVAVSERKPKEEHFYFIVTKDKFKGKKFFSLLTNEFNDNESKEVAYWLEEITEPIKSDQTQIEKLEAEKKELLEMLARMKINIKFTSEGGFGKLLTLEDVDKFTDEIEELLNRLKNDI